MSRPRPILVREVWCPVPTVRRLPTRYEQHKRAKRDKSMGLVASVLIVVPLVVLAKVWL